MIEDLDVDALLERVTRITVAIDVDGVVSPMVDPRDPLFHEVETGQAFRTLPAMLDAVVAEPIVQLLLELSGGESGDEAPQRDLAAEVLWHTSWWLKAPEALAPALGLPGLTGGIERMFATRDEMLGRTGRPASEWWKLTAVERWLREHPVVDGRHELLVWIDDDLDSAITRGEISADLVDDPRLVMISPPLRAGMGPGELTLLRSLTKSKQR